jgi:hypothetical protein
MARPRDLVALGIATLTRKILARAGVSAIVERA